MLQGTPTTFNESHAKAVFTQVGPHGLDFVRAGDWNPFTRPKIAFVGGWGEPGNQIMDEKDLQLVDSVEQVLELGDRPLNLQMFHR